MKSLTEMTCLGPNEMFYFFQPYVLLLPNSVLACFIYYYNSLMIFFLRNSVLCIYILRHKTFI